MNPGGLFVSSSGRVGIGTTNPSQILNVYSPASSDQAYLIMAQTSGAAALFTARTTVTSTYFGTENSSAGSTINGTLANASLFANQSATALQLGTNNNIRLTITNSGSVGVGTTNPGQLFEVVGGEIKAGRVDSSNEGGQISFGRSTDNATAWYIDAYGNVASPQLRFVNVSDAVVAMTITGSNVGIGTSSPDAPDWNGSARLLHIYQNTTNGSVIKLESSNAKGVIGVGNDAMQLGTISEDPLLFYTNVTERMRITSAGNVVLSQKLITSFTSNPSNVSAGGTTSFSLTQPTFEYQSTYFVSIIGLYAPSGVNQNGFYTGLVTFFNDSSNAQANVSALHANGWSLAVSATTGGTFTGTFTNASGATMSNVWIRILKINKTFDN
jgi:hypothetical protein